MTLIRECSLDDLPVLQRLSHDTYHDTFADMNTESDMNAYLEKAFNLGKLKNELLNKASRFYFIYIDGKLAGYLKLNESPAQTDIHDPSSLELERIYVLSEFQGKSIGRCLMDKAIEEAHKKKKTYIWLGVWEKNTKAFQFYIKHGFYQIGRHSFVMGNDVQMDNLLRKDIIL